MTETELKTLKELIIKTMGQLEESDTYLQEATQPIEPSVALGRLTRMEAIGEKSVNEAMHIKVKQRLERLKNALDRIEDGSYGVCVRCRKEMPFGRLEAVPESLVCVPCMEKKS
ncbi:TraR/DksA C4-type zinc finger protein [Oceanispirochaeta sp.]|jgi:DnaK suppressor protein|uniref:TraR/DksA family transcriptional regulator n=1 Tax=Oceanispirochaeta sp. TaxID=2035350 RepID=UPI00261FFC25|nr:TraR/DksA C4-type zinc finger protein [Oceanispirochaeta sp.]MDA3955924.1 TraR/DksA C4-type zinc finger protein [Oceanispirochaeta sp.]